MGWIVLIIVIFLILFWIGKASESSQVSAASQDESWRRFQASRNLQHNKLSVQVTQSEISFDKNWSNVRRNNPFKS